MSKANTTNNRKHIISTEETAKIAKEVLASFKHREKAKPEQYEEIAKKNGAGRKSSSQPLCLEKTSWKEIARIAAKGHAPRYFKVGDEKGIVLTTGEKITLTILGFNHDDKTDGSGKAPITFGMESVMQTLHKMNPTNSNLGGWHSSQFRTVGIPNIFATFPQELRNIIVPVSKKATIGNSFSFTLPNLDIVVSQDSLWLLSQIEVEGIPQSPLAIEGQQYEYWRTIRNGTSHLERIRHDQNGNIVFWWYRSPCLSNETQFRRVGVGGTTGVGTLANNHLGINFGFCI